MYDVIIIGSGPAGIGAAIELNKNHKNFLLIEKDTIGGKVNIAPRVDNYPNEKHIPGPDLALKLYDRLKANNISFVHENVISLTKDNDVFIVKTDNHIYETKTVLICSGTKERKLGLDKEDKLLGHGISYCALCDGHFFKNKDILVSGGGNAALKEAIHLAKIVNKLYLIHRRNEFRGNKALVTELSSFPNVNILTPYVPTKIIGEDHVEGVEIKNVQTGETKTIKVEGFFPLVGQIPSSSFIHIDGALNEYGYLIFNKEFESPVKFLFGAGDILTREIKQIYIAEHDGVMAAKSIIKALEK